MKKILYIMAIAFFSNSQLFAKQIRENVDSVETNITVITTNRVASDTISITFNSPFFDYISQINTGRNAVKTVTAIKNENGQYQFKFKTGSSPFHISLFLSNAKFEDYVIGRGDIVGYLIVPGSNVTINFAGKQITYAGNGAEILEIQDKIEKTDPGGQILDDNSLTASNTSKWLSREDSLLREQLKLLDTYKDKIPALAFSIIRADVIGLNRGAVYYWLSWTRPFIAKRSDLSSSIAEGYRNLQNDPVFIHPNDPAALSPKYVFYLYEKIKLNVKYERVINKLAPKMDQNYFQKIKADFNGLLRDKLLARWITDLAAVNNLHASEVADAKELMNSPYYTKIVDKLNAAYKKGTEITDFAFKNVKGQIVHLADFKGKVVVVDMWFTGCAECVAIVENMPGVERQFEERNDVVFVTISIDRDRNEWLKSVNRGGKYHISDKTIYLYTAGTGTRNPFIERYVPGNGYPQLLIIGKDGNLFSASLPHPVNDKLTLEFVDQVKSALKN